MPRPARIINAKAIFLFLSILMVVSLYCSPPFVRQWRNEIKVYSPGSWRDEFYGNRWCVARGFIVNQSLRGKTEAEVRDMLGFGKGLDRRARENCLSDGTKALSFYVHGRLREGDLSIYFKGDRSW